MNPGLGDDDPKVQAFALAIGTPVARRVQPASLHRLYQVEGVWHTSGDDDGVQSFMFIAKRMGLDPDVAKAMGEDASYLPTVRQAFDALVRWVETNPPAPSSQTVKPGEHLRQRLRRTANPGAIRK